MNNFNKELINKIKLFQSEENNIDVVEEKYYFIKYVFANLESLDAESLDICEEEFDGLKCNVDAYFFDEDNSTYNLYLGIYNDQNDDNATLSKEAITKEYGKIINFVKKIVDGKFFEFGEDSFTYEIADAVYKSLKDKELVVNVFTNYNVPSELQKDDIEEISGQRVSFRTYDLEDLENKFGQLNNDTFELDCREKFGEELSAVRISSTPDFDVYMCSMKGLWLATLYKEDSIRLLEANVRSYLKRTAKVNAGILDTVKNNPEEFVSFNNGISAVATEIKYDKDIGPANLAKIRSIVNFQIVNGGQTTATLYECFKDKLFDELKRIIVPVKLTVVKNISNSESLIRNISVFSNTQTAIKKSDPPSNLPYYIMMKQLSKSCLSNDINGSYLCYFERTNGEYDTEYRRNNGTKKFTNTNPKDKKFTKIDLAIAVNCWEQLPFKVCEGREKNFTLFNNTVKNQLIDPDDTYFKNAYACIVMFRKLDKIARKLKLSYKSNVVSYTLSLISLIYGKKLDLLKIWDLKDITPELNDVAYNLLPKVHQVIENTPIEHPEARMWARKEKCWDIVKTLTCDFAINTNSQVVEFFPKNEALVYIDTDENFFNSLVWMKLLLWDNKYKILNKQQQKMAKYLRSMADNPNVKLTLKQKDFGKDIFLFAVKSGFQYK